MRAKSKLPNSDLRLVFVTLFYLGDCLELLLQSSGAHATELARDQLGSALGVGPAEFGANLENNSPIKLPFGQQTLRQLNGENVQQQQQNRSQAQKAKFGNLRKFAAKFEAYKKLFRKHYANLTEHMHRFWVFIASLLRVSASKMAYSNNRKTYFLGINKFSDLNGDERRKLVGVSREKALEGVESNELVGALADTPKATRLKRHIVTESPEPEPEEEDHNKTIRPVDWRHSPDRCLMEQVVDQGDCEACYAISSMRLLEWHHCRHRGAQGTPARFSEQYLVDCGSPFGLAGCAGGHLKGLIDFVRLAGLLEASRRPFIGREAECGPLGPGEQWLEFELDHTRAKRHAAALVPRRVEFKFVELENWLGELRKQPLLVWADLSSGFYDYGGGLYEPDEPCDRSLGHYMLLVGFGYDAHLNRTYWLLYNSFGPDFGESGYVRVPAKSSDSSRKSDYQSNCLLYAVKVDVEF